MFEIQILFYLLIIIIGKINHLFTCESISFRISTNEATCVSTKNIIKNRHRDED